MSVREYEIESFTYEMRSTVLPCLEEAVAEGGGWLTGQRHLSPERTELVFELHTRYALDLYSALAGAGLELTRNGQQTLIALCGVGRYLGRRGGMGREPVSIRLVVRFLEDAPLLAFAGTRSVM